MGKIFLDIPKNFYYDIVDCEHNHKENDSENQTDTR